MLGPRWGAAAAAGGLPSEAPSCFLRPLLPRGRAVGRGSDSNLLRSQLPAPICGSSAGPWQGWARLPSCAQTEGPLAFFVLESQVCNTFTFSYGGSPRPGFLQLMDEFSPVNSFISACSSPLEIGGIENTRLAPTAGLSPPVPLPLSPFAALGGGSQLQALKERG